MSSKTQIFYCQQCLNQSFNPKTGIVCGLTAEKPTFQEECPEFEPDPNLQRSTFKHKKYSKSNYYHLPEKIQAQLLKEQNFKKGLLASSIVGIIGAVIWSLVTLLTGFNFGLLAILIGAMVSLSMRYFGKGLDQKFGISAAIISGISIIFAYLFSLIAIIANTYSANVFEVLFGLGPVELLQLTFSTTTVFSYVAIALALAQGYKFAFRVIPHKEIEKMKIFETPKSKELLDT